MTNICTGFIDYARSQPDAPAVRDRGVTTTYGQLSVQAASVAAGLRRLGVTPGDRVALGLAPGAGYVAAVLGVSAIGATYVPLDSRHASRRLTGIVERARCTVLLADAATTDTALADGVRVVALDELRAPASPLTVAELVEKGHADALYIMFTSGSTGVPKGVLINHAAVAQLIACIGGELTLTPGLVWSMVHSTAFDFSTWEMWGALLTGGVVTVASAASIADPRALCEFIAAESVSILSQTPSSFRRITADPELVGLITSGGHLRYVIFGGEALPSGVVRPWVDQVGFDRPTLINMYGITETTVHTTLHAVGPESLQLTHCPIGVPLPGRSVVIRADDGSVAAPGTVGELLVGGAGLAVGYLDDPELTARRFVTRDDETFYRSGDLGWVDGAGLLHHAGRMDREIKIRGHRIALEEVEAGVRRLPGVRDVVAVALPHPTHGGNTLIAYVTGDDLDTEEVHGLVRAELPAHMVPAHVIAIEALPLNANSKLDVPRLPEPWPKPAADGAASTKATSTKSTSTNGSTNSSSDESPESMIRQAFSDVLGYPLPEIDADADFFALGGDSLLAAYVFDAARWLRSRLSIADLFDDPTPAGLARRWHERADRNATTSAEPTPDSHGDLELPLTRAQEGLLVEWLNSDATVYQDGMLVRLDLPCSVDDLAAAIRGLGAVHPVLRTQIDIDAIGAEVRISAKTDVSVMVCDDRGGDPDAGMDRARAWIGRLRGERFDLLLDPLLRFRVGTLADGTYTVAIVGHHVICDGWSLSVLVRDIVDVCLGRADLTALVARGRQHLRILAATPAIEAADIDRYRNGAVPSTSTGAARRVVDAAGADGPIIERSATVGPALHRRAVTFARTAQTPVKSVYVAAHLAAVAESDAAGDVMSACVTLSGRPDMPEAQTCVGYFVRPRILDIPSRGQQSPEEYVRAVWQAEQRQLPTRHAPLSAQLAVRRRVLPPVMMNYVDFHVLNDVASAVLAREAYDENSFPLTVDIVSRGPDHGTTVTVRGRAAADVLERLAADHVAALAALISP